MPGVDTVTPYADGYVALQHHPQPVGIVAGLAQLAVAVILHEVMVTDLVMTRRAVTVDPFLVVYGIFPPAGVVGSAVFVAERTPGGVWLEPFLVARAELGKLRAAGGSLARLAVYLMKILLLGLIDALIVDLRELVELLSQLAVMFASLRVGEHADSLRPQIHRMEGKRRVGAVWI